MFRQRSQLNVRLGCALALWMLCATGAFARQSPLLDDPCAILVAEQASRRGGGPGPGGGSDRGRGGSEQAQRLFAFRRAFIDPALQEGQREGLADVVLHPERGVIEVRSQKGRQQHYYRLTNDRSEVFPGKGLPDVTRSPHGRSSSCVFHWQDAFDHPERTMGIIRSSWRDDHDLHPLLFPHDSVLFPKAVLAHPQADSLAALLEMEDWPSKTNYMRGLVMSPGMGKTIVVARYVREVAEDLKGRGDAQWSLQEGKVPNVLYVLENEEALEGAIEKFAREFDYEPAERQSLVEGAPVVYKGVARAFGQHRRSSHNRKLDDKKAIFITRTGYFQRMAEIHKLMKARGSGPWVVVLDEAHHIGRDNGQFEAILDDLNSFIDDRHRVVLLSATLWHQDQAIIQRYLKGKVYGALLREEDGEQALLRAGEDLQSLCQIQFMRGVAQGYLSPLFGLNIINDISGTPTAELIAYGGIDRETGRRVVDIYPSLAKDSAKRMKRDRVVGTPDRGVYFVGMREQADGYAPILQKELGFGAEVRPLHGGSNVDRKDTLDWFSNRGKYDTAAERAKHKYVIVVNILKEAVDLPQINRVVLWRPYFMERNGFALMLQAMTRADRAGKPYFNVYDYTGFTVVFKGGLEEIMMESSSPSDAQARGEPLVVVNNVVMTVTQFRERYLDLFPMDGSFQDRFPFYHRERFVQGAVQVMHREAKSFGISNFTLSNDEHSGPLGLFLSLARRPVFDSVAPERDAYIEWLRNEVSWYPQDGAYAKRGRPPSCERVYEAYHRLVQLLTLTPQGEALDLRRLNEVYEMEAVLVALAPERVPRLTNAAAKAVFIDPDQGGFAVVANEAYFDGFTHFDREYQAMEFALRKLRGWEIGDSLPNATECRSDREALLGRMGSRPAWGWGYSDGSLRERHTKPRATGQGRRPPHREGFQRIYAFLYATAAIANKAGARIDLDKIHTAAEVEKLFDFIDPVRVPVQLDAAQRATFSDRARGATGVFCQNRWLHRYDISSFGLDWGYYFLIQALLDRVLWPEIDASPALVAEIEAVRRDFEADEKWQWSKNGGRMVADASEEGPTQRYYRALYKIAMLLKRTKRGRELDLSQLHTLKGFQAFIDLLEMGIVAPVPTQAVMASFVRERTGGFQVLVERSTEFGANYFFIDGGMQTVAVALASSSKIKDSPTKAHLVELLSDDLAWAWTAHEATMVRKRKPGTRQYIVDQPRAVKRVLRMLYAVAYLLLESDNLVDIDLTRLHTREEVTKLLDALSDRRANEIDQTEIPAHLDASQLATFGDREQGAVGILFGHELAKRLGVQNMRRDWGYYYVLQELLDRVLKMEDDPDPALVAEVDAVREDLRDIEKWGWTEWGASMVGAQAGPTQQYYRALYRIGMLLQKTERGRGLDLSTLHTREGFQTFIDLLEIGFVVPLPSEEVMAAFVRGDTGGFQVLLERTKEFGVSLLFSNGGMQKLAVRFAGSSRIKESDAKTHLVELLQDKVAWGWSATEGSQVRKFDPDTNQHVVDRPQSARRVWRMLYAVGYLLLELDPDAGIDLRLLHTREGVTRLLDALVEN